MRGRLGAILVVTALVLAAAACSSDDDGGDEAGTAATSATDEPATSTTADSTDWPTEASTSSTGRGTPTTIEAPELLGTPVADGLEYPNPTTCRDAEALYQRLLANDEASVSGALWGRSGYWLAVDSTSVSADVLIPEGAPERILVEFRGGVLVGDAGVPADGVPVLTPQVAYAYVSVSADGTSVTCEEGQAVG